jgi:hypothetical protein
MTAGSSKYVGYGQMFVLPTEQGAQNVFKLKLTPMMTGNSIVLAGNMIVGWTYQACVVLQDARTATW